MRCGICNQQRFIESVRANLNDQICFVCLQCSIEVGDSNLPPTIFAAWTCEFLRWTSRCILSFDEEIAGSSINVEIVVQSANVHAESEVISHVIEPIAFKCCLVREMRCWSVEDPHIMSDTMLLAREIMPLFSR
jgi:hypothetical protein